MVESVGKGPFEGYLPLIYLDQLTKTFSSVVVYYQPLVHFASGGVDGGTSPDLLRPTDN